MTFAEIEKFYCSYYRMKEKLEEFTENKEHVLTGSPVSGGDESETESKVLQKIQIELTITMIEKCLDEMTRDEKNFIGCRYFRQYGLSTVAGKMRWSEREIHRLRHSVLAKTQWFLRVQKYFT